MFFRDVVSRRLHAGSRLLAHANEAVLPFCLFPRTAILGVGWNNVPWRASMPVKYAVIMAASFAIIMAPHELLIRRANVCRALFGMRWKRRAQ